MNSPSKADRLHPELHPEARTGIRLFNEGKFYPAHDHLELAWRDTPGEDGILYKGILQVGIAYYHIRRGNHRGALKMFHRAQRNLAGLPEKIQGVDVKQLRADAGAVESQLKAGHFRKHPEADNRTFRQVPLLRP